MNSSSAYKLEQREYYSPKRQIDDRKVIKLDQSIVKKNKIKTLFSVLTFFAITFFIIFRYTAIIEASNTANSYKKELTNLQRVAEQTQIQLDRSIDLNKVEEIAKNKLGMDRPTKSQIVYVKPKKNDFSEIVQTAKYASAKKNSYWVDFLNTITNVLGFFN